MDALRTLEMLSPAITYWDGYLTAPSNDSFTFISISDAEPVAITLDEVPATFPHRRKTLQTFELSDPVSPIAGHLSTLFVPDRLATQLS